MVDNKAMCAIAGYEDVFATGTGTFVSGPASSLSMEVAHTMDIYCYPSDVGRLPLLESFEFPILYDPDSDMFLDGSTRVTEDNPFVGRWEGTDVDGSVLTMTIRASGVYEQSDTSSTTCKRVGLDDAPWASYEWAEFDLEPAPKAFLTGTNVCFDSDGDPVVATALTDTEWFWSYQAEDDTIIFRWSNARKSRDRNRLTAKQQHQHHAYPAFSSAIVEQSRAALTAQYVPICAGQWQPIRLDLATG